MLRRTVALETDVVEGLEDWRAKQRPIPSVNDSINILLRKVLKEG